MICFNFITVTVSSLAPVRKNCFADRDSAVLLFIDVFVGKNNSTWNSVGAQF